MPRPSWRRVTGALRDLGSTEDDVKQALKIVVPKEQPGVVNRILELWQEATKKPYKAKPVPPPKLPSGTKIDLSLEEMKIDEVNYEIPKSVGTPDKPGAVTKAASLTNLQ